MLDEKFRFSIPVKDSVVVLNKTENSFMNCFLLRPFFHRKKRPKNNLNSEARKGAILNVYYYKDIL